ncbi:MAG TPA: efflux RND transporter periplasmic adaptor subunit [Bryobacteraceae bacterium]|nr:efflux RND transporter periplasmic adaptor subunit [Bryobacteraceae bacterium]
MGSKKAAGFWVLGAGLVLAGCGTEVHKSEPVVAPARVQTVMAASEQWPDTYEASGTVRARTAAAISSQVMASVREVHVQVGSRVHPGDPLVSLDARSLDADYRRAEAGRDEARQAQAEAGQALASAKAQLDLAKATFARMQELFDKKSISNQEFDEATAHRKAAEAAYEMAAAKVAQVRARIAAAEQAVEAAGVMRGYAEIRAPFAGVVTAKSVDPGSMATPGAPLMTIERDGVYRLEAAVEESRAASIRVGQPVSVNLEALDRSLEAHVSEIVPAVDAASRAYTVKIDLPAVARLRSGMFGRAVFSSGVRNVLAVPAAAVSEHGQLQSVMVADGGYAHTRLITLGQKSGDKVEVLSGLSAGEKVVYPLPPALTDGARVETRP